MAPCELKKSLLKSHVLQTYHYYKSFSWKAAKVKKNGSLFKGSRKSRVGKARCPPHTHWGVEGAMFRVVRVLEREQDVVNLLAVARLLHVCDMAFAAINDARFGNLVMIDRVIC